MQLATNSPKVVGKVFKASHEVPSSWEEALIETSQVQLGISARRRRFQWRLKRETLESHLLILHYAIQVEAELTKAG